MLLEHWEVTVVIEMVWASRMTGRCTRWFPGSGGRLKALNWNLHSFQLFEIIQVSVSISWVRCASGNVLGFHSVFKTSEHGFTIVQQIAFYRWRGTAVLKRSLGFLAAILSMYFNSILFLLFLLAFCCYL